MRRVCVILGLALLLGAAALTVRNERESAAAGERAAGVLAQMVARLPSETRAAAEEMTVVEIDGCGYIGYISIPKLELELPVMAEWDYERLETAPCRYGGTVAGGDLVIIGHNYRRHFGPIRRLEPGDQVTFVDTDGRETGYQVTEVRQVSADAVEAVTDSGFALALVTCTYGGEARTAVFCRLEAISSKNSMRPSFGRPFVSKFHNGNGTTSLKIG